MQKTFKLIPYAVLVILMIVILPVKAAQHKGLVYIDDKGVLCWEDTHKEASLFGVNYIPSFHTGYYEMKKLGLSPKQAIDLDVAQMVRLGFNAFRIHLWDVEISDSLGNLVENEHLDVLYYLLAKLAENGIVSIITPLTWYSSIEQGITKGFSQYYSKTEGITNENARKAQKVYFTQLVQYINPYRGMSLNDDPFIIGIEIFNEPYHPQDTDVITSYINEMIVTLHQAGFTKPLFYNIAQNWSTNEQMNAVVRSNIDGYTFQWYPTDLVHAEMLKGNYLVNVSKYDIPPVDDVSFATKPKIVYEFDAADIGSSVMYPAIARSFREAGMQFAAMFTYDPSPVAWSNIEFITHNMNLLYTPRKAISLMIAAKAFQQLPINVGYGDYPENNHFGDFSVNFEQDLSEMMNDSVFIYTNSTNSLPESPDKLRHVAGCGNSSVANYDGTGAYFLDRLSKGIWRLEIYPDVLSLRDPFKTISSTQQVARLFWNDRKIEINLPDLGKDYMIYPVDSVSNIRMQNNQTNSLRPGKYLLAAKNIDRDHVNKYLTKKEIFLPHLFTPPSDAKVCIVNKTSQYAMDSTKIGYTFQIASDEKISGANLYVKSLDERAYKKYPLTHNGGFDYSLIDTSGLFGAGRHLYCVTVATNDTIFTFPEGNADAPNRRWNVPTVNNCWHIDIVKPNEDVVLFESLRDRSKIIYPHTLNSTKYTIKDSHGPTLTDVPLSLTIFFDKDEIVPFGMQCSIMDCLGPLLPMLKDTRAISVKARSTTDYDCTMGINLITTDGQCYGADCQVGPEWQVIDIPISQFKVRDALLLPNQWPVFFPQIRKTNKGIAHHALNLGSLQHVQVLVDPAHIPLQNETRITGFEILTITAKNQD